MKALKWIMVCAILVSGIMTVAAQPPAGGREGAGSTMTAEERAKLAEEASTLAAQAVAKEIKLSEEATAAFVKNYVTESKASSARMQELRTGQDREAMMAAMTANREKMAEAIKKGLTEEQGKVATTLLGGFSSLERSIESLLRAKVEKEKITKALPVLVANAKEMGELMTAMRAENADRTALMPKMTTLREKLVTELTPIIGEEAAKSLNARGMGMRGTRPAGAAGQGGGARQRGAGGAGGNQ